MMLHIMPMTLRGAEESPIPGSGVRIGGGRHVALGCGPASSRALGFRSELATSVKTKKKKTAKLANVVVACISLYKGTPRTRLAIGHACLPRFPDISRTCAPPYVYLACRSLFLTNTDALTPPSPFSRFLWRFGGFNHEKSSRASKPPSARAADGPRLNRSR